MLLAGNCVCCCWLRLLLAGNCFCCLWLANVFVWLVNCSGEVIAAESASPHPERSGKSIDRSSDAPRPTPARPPPADGGCGWRLRLEGAGGARGGERAASARAGQRARGARTEGPAQSADFQTNPQTPGPRAQPSPQTFRQTLRLPDRGPSPVHIPLRRKKERKKEKGEEGSLRRGGWWGGQGREGESERAREGTRKTPPSPRAHLAAKGTPF